MKIPGVLFVIIATMVPPTITTITDLGIPENLQECFLRMSQSSKSFLFSATSRQNYCLKQYLNRRRRREWFLEPSLTPERNEFKVPNLAPLEPDYNRDAMFWSPPFRQWQYPTVNNFWRSKTPYWPPVQSSLNKVWKPTTKAPHTWNKHTFIRTTTTTTTPTPKPELFTTTTSVPPVLTTSVPPVPTQAPLNWRKKPVFNRVPINNRQRTRYWRAPMWSVVPKVIRIPDFRYNNQWRYPNWNVNYPWNGYRNRYDIPEYPSLSLGTIPE